MIPYYIPSIGKKELEAVSRVMQSGHLTQGKEVEKLEDSYCKYSGCKYSVALSNATIGLFLSAMAIKENCILYIQNNTFIADFQAARLATKLNDNINGFSLHKDLCPAFECKCAGELGKQYGIQTHIDGKVYNTIFDNTIHDCAHLFPVKIKDKNAVSFVYSLHGSKIIGVGEGGIVCTNKKYIYAFIRLARQHGRDKTGYDYKYTDNLVNGNYKLSDVHAAIANSLIKRKDELLFARQNIARFYCDKLGMEFDEKHQYHLFQYDCKTVERAQKIEKAFKRNSVEYSKHFIPISRLLKWPVDDKYDYEMYQKTLSLPIWPGLTLLKLKYIIDIIRSVK